MPTLTERKISNWRALVVYKDGREGLLLVGSNFSYVTEHYDEPFFNLLEKDERDNVAKIQLQKWIGAADSGHWATQKTLSIPQEIILPIKSVG